MDGISSRITVSVERCTAALAIWQRTKRHTLQECLMRLCGYKSIGIQLIVLMGILTLVFKHSAEARDYLQATFLR